MKLKYIGGGHLPNVPSRDLTAGEVKKHGEKMLLASTLYIKHTRDKKKTTTKKEV